MSVSLHIADNVPAGFQLTLRKLEGGQLQVTWPDGMVQVMEPGEELTVAWMTNPYLNPN